MKTIGLLGGMSWESSAAYYRIINQEIHKRLGGLHSAQIIMYSVNFAEIERLQRTEQWERATEYMVSAAQRLVAGGADCILICTNTMHIMADSVQQRIPIPLIHIADSAAHAIRHAKKRTVGILGTSFTMEKEFYKDRLRRHNLQSLTPLPEERAMVHTIIYHELCIGIVTDESRALFVRVINTLAQRGADCILLACTEIGLLVEQEHVDIPLFDTTPIHCMAAVDFAQ